MNQIVISRQHILVTGLLSALFIPVDAEMNDVSLEHAQKVLGFNRR